MRVAVIGLDIAKSVFQVHGADEKGRPVLERRLRRAEFFGSSRGLSRVAWVSRLVTALTFGLGSLPSGVTKCG
jgi:hypothetical protein